jgi:hypothetical protein
VIQWKGSSLEQKSGTNASGGKSGKGSVQGSQIAEERKGLTVVTQSSGNGGDHVAVRSEGGLEKRMVPRFAVSGVVFKTQTTGKLYDVLNVSTQGAGIRLGAGALAAGADGSRAQDDLLVWTLGARIEGSLKLQDQVLPLQLKVVFRQGARVGCEWEQPSAEVSARLEALLSPEVLGRELKALPFHKPSFSENTSEDARSHMTGAGQASSPFRIERHWFHGASGTDVLVEATAERPQQVIELAIYLLGFYIEIKRLPKGELGIRTGVVQSVTQAASQGQLQELDAVDVTLDSAPDQEKLSVAKRMVLSSNLPQWVKSLFEEP